MSWKEKALAACFLALLFGQVALRLELRSVRASDAAALAARDEALVSMTPAFFRTVTFGLWTAGLDWLWIRTLADPSIVHVAKGAHPRAYYDLLLMTELDPAFFDLYYGGANILAVIRDDGPGARDLLEKARAFLDHDLASYPSEFRGSYWPHPWQIPLLFGYVELFELDDLPAAAERFGEAARYPGAPPYLARLQRRLSEPGGPYEVGLKLLDFMISGQKDERAVERLTARKESLQVSYFLYRLNERFRAFLKGRPAGERLWGEFARSEGGSGTDPFGGRLSLDGSGKVVTATPHPRVFGLE